MSIFQTPITATAPVQTLAEYLEKVSRVVRRSFASPEWVSAEIVHIDAPSSRGYAQIQLTSLDKLGHAVSCKAHLWPEEWARIARNFEDGTGFPLAKGHRILLLTEMEFHTAFGLRLRPLQIDPQFTLGEAEARRRSALKRLQAEGLISANRSLPPPFDARRIVVISPAEAQGLADFNRKILACRQFKVLEADYIAAQFQSARAEQELVSAFDRIGERVLQGFRYDLVVVLRGGGSASDFVFLNTYPIGRALCTCPVPVVVGVGHDKDRSLLDDVAFHSCSTPSLAATYIVDLIKDRAAQWREMRETCNRETKAVATRAASILLSAFESLPRSTDVVLARAQAESTELFHRVHLAGSEILPSAGERASRNLQLAHSSTAMALRNGDGWCGRYLGLGTQAGCSLLASTRFLIKHQVECAKQRSEEVRVRAEEVIGTVRHDFKGFAGTFVGTCEDCDRRQVFQVAECANRSLAAWERIGDLALGDGRLAAAWTAGGASNACADVREQIRSSASPCLVRLAETVNARLRAARSASEAILSNTSLGRIRLWIPLQHIAGSILSGAAGLISELRLEVYLANPMENLRRGFAIIRSAERKAVGSLESARRHSRLIIQFFDGEVSVERKDLETNGNRN